MFIAVAICFVIVSFLANRHTEASRERKT
jgi:hypothetical protein